MYEILLITLRWQFIMFMDGAIHQGHVNMDVGGSACKTSSALLIECLAQTNKIVPLRVDWGMLRRFQPIRESFIE